MRAITFDTPGGPEVLHLGPVPDPSPMDGEVLVRVRATAVNRADLMQRAGHYPPPPGASEILGLECAGEIIDIPAGTDTHFALGQRVMCLLSGGGYAEMVAVPIGQVMAVPTPLAIECTSATSPGRPLPSVTRAIHAVRKTSGIAAACSQLSPSGTAIT